MAGFIAQKSPAKATWEPLYAPSANRIATGVLTGCNTSGQARSIRVAVTNGTGNPVTGNHIKFDEQTDYFQMSNIMIPAGFVLQVWSSDVGYAFTFMCFDDPNINS